MSPSVNRQRLSLTRAVSEAARRILPPLIFEKLRQSGGLMQFYSSPYRKVVAESRKLHGQGRGRRAFLLATGPSLKHEDLTRLAGEDCFSVSNFYLHESIDVIRPRIHFFAPYHPPLILENYVDWLREADARLPGETAICLAHPGYNLVLQHRLFPQRTIHYLYFSTNYTPKTIDLGQPILAATTGPLMILPVLIAMGYETIYLLGCDHTVLRDFGRTITHFYDRGKEMRKNASGEGVWINIIESHLRSLMVFQQYGYYRDILAQHYSGRARIVNLSTDSWLDLFPFDRLDHVLTSTGLTRATHGG
jgi:hypothetical protein